VIAKRTYDFKSLGLVFLIASLLFVGMLGWIANGAWYNYYFFSDYIYPNYSVQKDDEFPNQFLFIGTFEKGSATTLIRKVMGADSVDWDRPIVLEINSDGGSPQVAIIMSEFISQYDIEVEVMGKCISACTLVLLTSKHRYIHPSAWIGFHASYMCTEGKENSYNNPSLKFYDDLLEKYLDRLEVSSDFKEKTRIQDSIGGFFPSYENLIEENIANKIERNYLGKTTPSPYL
jgi:hypothetical protein